MRFASRRRVQYRNRSPSVGIGIVACSRIEGEHPHVGRWYSAPATPNDHLASRPHGRMITTAFRCPHGGDRRPSVGQRIVLCPIAKNGRAEDKATPNEYLLARPDGRMTEPRGRSSI